MGTRRRGIISCSSIVRCSIDRPMRSTPAAARVSWPIRFTPTFSGFRNATANAVRSSDTFTGGAVSRPGCEPCSRSARSTAYRSTRRLAPLDPIGNEDAVPAGADRARPRRSRSAPVRCAHQARAPARAGAAAGSRSASPRLLLPGRPDARPDRPAPRRARSDRLPPARPNAQSHPRRGGATSARRVRPERGRDCQMFRVYHRRSRDARCG